VLKPHAGRLVVGWVTTSESLLFGHDDPLSGNLSDSVVVDPETLPDGNDANNLRLTCGAKILGVHFLDLLSNS
ncbi:hypothetical protein NYO67_10209, partial [Aspergillus flavus]